jgi:hypothetical protein
LNDGIVFEGKEGMRALKNAQLKNKIRMKRKKCCVN